MLRVMRVVFVGVAAWVAFHYLEPSGHGWLVLVAAVALVLFWIGYRYFIVIRRRRADAQSDKWASALLDPPRRKEAIDELRTRRSRARGVEHARFSLILAEMLEADGDMPGASQVLDEVDRAGLPERTLALVAHGRAVAALSAGDSEKAEVILDAVGPCGDRVVDLRVRLMRGAVAAERGDAERALEVAEQARRDAAGDDDLKMEARVLKAVALDALGDRADAVKVIRALDQEMLEVLLVLGLPRVKVLAQAAIDAD
jgi:hypothetical protein